MFKTTEECERYNRIKEILSEGEDYEGWKFHKQYRNIIGGNVLVNEAQNTCNSMGSLHNAVTWLMEQYKEA